MSAFDLLLPRGWMRIDLRGPYDDQIRRAVDRMLGTVPATRKQGLRDLVEPPLAEMAARLAAEGAVCLLLPTDSPADLPVRPTVVVQPLAVPPGQQPMDLLTAVAASDPTASIVDVGSLVALRTTSDVDVTGALVAGLEEKRPVLAGVGIDVPAWPGRSAPGGGTTTPTARMTSRRVRYQLGDPTSPQQWLDIFCLLHHAEEEGYRDLGDAMIELFDAMVHTLRWTS